VGAFVGGFGGGSFGAGGGTLALPGGGTIAGGWALGSAGAAAGTAWGSAAGWAIGYAWGNTILMMQGSGGRLGSPETPQQIGDIAGQLESEGYTVTGGGGRAPEEYIPGSGPGTRGGTYVDITATNGNSTVRVQTIDTYANGQATAREAAAAQRIRNAFPNDILRLIPKN
jgi:filamentous hemagglutinin